MDVEEMGARLSEFTLLQQDRSALTAAELDGLLAELNGMATAVHGLAAADQQSSTAKIDDLKRRFTDWYNTAVEAQQTGVGAIGNLAVLDNEFHDLRERWVIDGGDRSQLEARMIHVLSQADARPEGEQLALHIQSFLREDVARSH